MSPSTTEQDTFVNIKLPKKPLSAYNFFFREKRAQLLQVKLDQYDPNKKQRRVHRKGKVESPSLLVLTQQISAMWKECSAEDRAKYEELAAEDNRRYREDMKQNNGGKKLREDNLEQLSANKFKSSMDCAYRSKLYRQSSDGFITKGCVVLSSIEPTVSHLHPVIPSNNRPTNGYSMVHRDSNHHFTLDKANQAPIMGPYFPSLRDTNFEPPSTQSNNSSSTYKPWIFSQHSCMNSSIESVESDNDDHSFDSIILTDIEQHILHEAITK